MDDLDRCLPETAIETIEAIRLFCSSRKQRWSSARMEDDRIHRAPAFPGPAARNRPWLGAALTHAHVQAGDASKREQLDSAFVLAAGMGPVLGEGAKGNSRQVKRF